MESDPETKVALDEARKKDMLEGATVTEITTAQEVDVSGCAPNAVVAQNQENVDDKAQDEPVGLVWRDKEGKEDWRFTDKTESIKDADLLPYTEMRLVYTRPQSDKLRKAAEVALEFIEGSLRGLELIHFSHTPAYSKIKEIHDQLRAALEGE